MYVMILMMMMMILGVVIAGLVMGMTASRDVGMRCGRCSRDWWGRPSSMRHGFFEMFQRRAIVFDFGVRSCNRLNAWKNT
jgi:hypothetical protein